MFHAMRNEDGFVVRIKVKYKNVKTLIMRVFTKHENYKSKNVGTSKRSTFATYCKYKNCFSDVGL